MNPLATYSTVGFAALSLLGLAALVGANASCASAPDRKRYTEIVQPDYATYRDLVDPYIQRRCGTLDCHGQPGRAYRLYGYWGFRLYTLDAGLVSGVNPTQEDEIRANYQAAVALEPEEMSRAIAGQGEDLSKLLLLRKPLQLERHKGGPAMAQDDPGYRCVQAWLRVRTVRPAADGFFETIPVEERESISESGRRACLDAAGVP